jgi:hypothetical protein
MSRRTLKADGTITVKSWSYLGEGDPQKAFQEDMARIDEYNRKALAEWNLLTPEARAQRIASFEKPGTP